MWSGRPAVLAFVIRRDFCRSGRADLNSRSPRLLGQVCRSTSISLPVSQRMPMPKPHVKFDRNPFMPEFSPATCGADMVLVFCVALFALAGVVGALLQVAA